MDTLSFKQHIENLFKNSSKFSDSEGNLDIHTILESIESIDTELIKVLKNDEKAKETFFTQVEDIYILNQNRLIEFFALNDYMKNGSYTSYTNKIGLVRKDSFIKKFDDVVLAFPHKDCVLEGGQTKDDDKSKEVFYNEIIASDEIDRLFEPKVLTNIKRYSKDGVEDNPMIQDDDNLIIKGNNLIALHSLKKKYAGQVKLIYIDPPYNTGNDSFKYNDNFNHSTWLTFMKNRLEIAREFLSDDGNIIIQIDWNESHYLKILLDEIFGKYNFLNEIIWHYEKWTSNSKNLQKNHDNIFVYSKNKGQHKFNLIKEITDNLKDKYEKGYLFGGGGGSTGLVVYDKNKPEVKKLIESGKYTVVYAETEGKPLSDVWKIPFINPVAKERIGFNSQKLEVLLKRLLEVFSNENDLIMDFHLGSGTTCAVAHKMGRKYIGIEQMDYIENISVERLKKVVDGEQGGISKAVNWQGGGSFIYAELKQIDTFKNCEVKSLNTNMQYLPIDEIEDEEYSISKEEIVINKAFYGLENE